MRVDGAWVNVAGCGCVNACGCGTAAAQVTVPGPVARVNAIIVDGAALDPSAYRVDNYRHIVRQDGGRWPTCVHMGDPDPGGWTIDYGHGFPVPAGGRFAAGVLACELAKACSGQPCGLPRNVTSIVRQGVTVTRSDLDTLLDAGRFGLFEVDAWVASVQPSMPSHMLAVETPDVQPVRFQTWP